MSSPTQSTAKHKGNTAKEDKPPAVRRNSGHHAKGQGKITDFISPARQVLANKNNKQNAKTQAANKDSETAQETFEKPRGRGRPPKSAAASSTPPTSLAAGRRRRKARSPDPSSSDDDEEEEMEEEDDDDDEVEEEEEQEEEESPPPSPTPPKKGRGRPKQYVFFGPVSAGKNPHKISSLIFTSFTTLIYNCNLRVE